MTRPSLLDRNNNTTETAVFDCFKIPGTQSFPPPPTTSSPSTVESDVFKRPWSVTKNGVPNYLRNMSKSCTFVSSSTVSRTSGRSTVSRSTLQSIVAPNPSSVTRTGTKKSGGGRTATGTRHSSSKRPTAHSGFVTNPEITKKYSITSLLDILCGNAPAPQGMFTKEPEDVPEISPIRSRFGLGTTQTMPVAKSNSIRQQEFLEDFDASSSFSINITEESDNNSPLADISNSNQYLRPRSRGSNKRPFFVDTQVEELDGFDLVPPPTKTRYFGNEQLDALFPDEHDLITSQFNEPLF
ncbi:uncharacterized protein LOC110849272 [Folsomia candida]|nr:uncharacterized protein LOC110849272 [Folsomia candida]